MTTHSRHIASALLLSGLLCFGQAALAQQLPGPADASRFDADQKRRLPEEQPATSGQKPEISVPVMKMPENAGQIRVAFSHVAFKGVTVFSEDELRALYAPYVGGRVTLTEIYGIAGALTKLYRDRGYFLSRAYVPQQDIVNGVVRINAVEGYVKRVEVENDDNESVAQSVAKITGERPLRVKTLESQLLYLNDIPGTSYRAVVEPLENARADDEGGVLLRLVPAGEKPRGSISLNNFGSRYLGPYQATLSYAGSLIPGQQTALTAMTTSQPQEIKYLSLGHSADLGEGFTAEGNVSVTKANPGYALKDSDVESDALSFGLTLGRQLIRQRQQNLSLGLTFDYRNGDTDILKAEFVKDKVRALRLRADYDTADFLSGYDYLSLTLSQGLDALGASQENDADLSRTGAGPDFRKAEFALTRYQNLGAGFMAVTAASAQIASGPLFSSEQFGYGGQAFGRAYDASEIVGDHGIAGSLELRYTDIGKWNETAFVPYMFYDVGKVWNDVAGVDEPSGSSAGIGVLLDHDSGFSGNFLIAQPLTREVAAPPYGNGKNPRYLFNIGYRF